MRLIHLSNQNALFLIWTGKLSRLNSVRNESSAVFNTPKLSKGGKITSTAKWSYKTMDEFWAFFKNAGYRNFTSEHWSKRDFGTPYINMPNSIQVVRIRFANI